MLYIERGKLVEACGTIMALINSLRTEKGHPVVQRQVQYKEMEDSVRGLLTMLTGYHVLPNDVRDVSGWYDTPIADQIKPLNAMDMLRRQLADSEALASHPPKVCTAHFDVKRSRRNDLDHLRKRSLDDIPKNARNEDGSPIVNLGTQNNEGDS